MASSSVRMRSASPKSVSFSPTLSRKYGEKRAPPPPPQKFECSGYDWRVHFADFSAYLDALLADLQNSIGGAGAGGGVGPRSPGGPSPGYGSLNGAARAPPVHDYHNVNKPVSPTYQNQQRSSGGSTGGGSMGGGTMGGGPMGGGGTGNSTGVGTGSLGRARGNLSELDSLLHDLSTARYADQSYHDHTDGYGKTNGTLSPARTTSAELQRPSVDSLLDQLSEDLANGGAISPTRGSGATRQVTVTVQETVVEPVAQQAHHHHHHHQHAPPHAPTHGPPHGPPHASNATKELDDLMASLSDFKVSQSGGVHHHQAQPDLHQQVLTERRAWQERYHATTQPAPAQPSHDGNLERMLGSLRADMSRQGVQTPQKGCCSACDKPIVGQVITALGRTWHPEHFTCAHCTQELGTRNFFERDGKPYCEPDYHNLFSPRCAYCNGPILDKCVTALEKTWHTEHFFCAQCGQQFGEDGFHEREGKPYCRTDYFDMFAPKCGGCQRPIMENYISALNSQWHSDCFVCRDCKMPVQGKSFYAMEGKPVCPTCVGVDEDDA